MSKKVKITVHFDEETYERLVEDAKIYGTTKSNLIREAVRESFVKPEGLATRDSSETLRNIQENAIRGRMRAENLQDEAYVETSDLLTAEHLVKNCGFEVITVEGPVEEQGKPKLW
ncbi:MAG: ribbon-helix-helix protein, CopG family, partial [Desulfobacteraceae bacterium]